MEVENARHGIRSQQALVVTVNRGFGADEVLLSVNPLFHVVGMQQVAAMLGAEYGVKLGE